MNKVAGRIILLAAIALLVIPSNVSAAGPPNPFTGAWENTDIADGSSQVMYVGGPVDATHIRYTDFGSTACGEFDPETGEPTVVASFSGIGYVDESNVLHLENVDFYCQYPDGRGRTDIYSLSVSWELLDENRLVLLLDGNVFTRR